MDPPQDSPAPPQEPEREKPQGYFPRPPPITSAADFIVIIFAVSVVSILLLLTVGVIIAAFKGNDIKSYFAIITSIVTSIISALVGYLAGKGQGRADAEKQDGA
jgi:hypothetical protein